MYFIRVDDLKEDMDIKIFENIITYFSKIKIKPLLAVIPYSKNKNDDFWKKIKKLQNDWYTIWLHWYNHKLRKNIWKSLIPIQNYSEFVWLDINEQNKKIKKWMQIFKKHGISIQIFVAPAHWQDKKTIITLKKNGIKYVSDWFFLYPKLIEWIKFFPQQLWWYKYIPIWFKTICLHIWDFKNLENKILIKINNKKDFFSNFNEIFYFDKTNIFQKIVNFVFNFFRFSLLFINKYIKNICKKYLIHFVKKWKKK